MRVALRVAVVAPLMLGLTGCFSFFGGSGEDAVPVGDRQLPASTQAMLAVKGMKIESPIFIRIFKEESELELWKYKDGRFQLFKTYQICAWSGELGPKVQQGDRQAPEGFYTVSAAQMNPHSLYHLAFNIGFPNAHDQANGFSGSALMVHGNCKSAGCYAMTDAYIEEIFILAREAFNAGQTRFHVQALPFRMTTWKMLSHRGNRWYPFWAKLKEGYDYFEETGKPPVVKVCGKQYMVNVAFQGGEPAASAPCPLYSKIDPRHIPGIDGVPQTLLASLDRGEAPGKRDTQAQAPIVVAAAAPLQSTPKAPAPMLALAETSASPVISRPAHPPTPVHATKAPASPNYAVQPASPSSAPSPVRVASGGSAVQPVTYRFDAPQVASDDAKADDPDAIQKPNRSGKGGKLGPSSSGSDSADAQH